MIQRIQTVYLLLALIALGATYFLPLAEAIGTLDSLVLYSYQIVSLVPDSTPNVPYYFMWPMQGISAILFVLTMIVIGLYKNRRVQLKLMSGMIVLLLILIALFFFYYESELELASDGLVTYKLGAYLPIVTFVFYLLAYRAITADEKLIRSMDRLR